MFGEVVCYVNSLGKPSDIYDVVGLLILDPVVVHGDSFEVTGFYGLFGEAGSDVVISDDDCGALGMAEIGECLAEDDCCFCIGVNSSDFSFRG